MSTTTKTPIRLSDQSDRMIRARYDAAQTTDDNRRHWAAADSLSADAANSLPVRKALRERARYEEANNSFLKGLISTVANDTVGTGPTLQMLVGQAAPGKSRIAADDAFNSQLEGDFAEWAREIRLAEKLRILRQTRMSAGELLAMLVYNPKLTSPVKLDIMLVEADQCTDPTWQSAMDPLWSDGIRYDELGNPISYRVLKNHPGAQNWQASSLDFDDIPARFVFHYFKRERPGQRRGIPEITPALSIFPDLRRFCAAVIRAAEAVADIAIAIQSDASAEETADVEPLDKIELEKGVATTMPKGWKLGQTKAEQPTTTYPSFVDKKLAEAARCINVPFTIAALDSSNANLSARYLDSQIYARGIAIDRSELEIFLDMTLDAWLTEAIRARRPDGKAVLARVPDAFPHKWNWPSSGEHADPGKVASAQATKLKTGTTTLAREYAAIGQDWENEQESAARSMGVSIDEYRALLRFGIFGTADASSVRPTAPGQPDQPKRTPAGARDDEED